MLDIGWQELFIIGVLVIIVVGPKDLPRALRAVAGVVRKARSMAREFQGGLDDMMRESELDEIKNQVEQTGKFDIGGAIDDAIDPTGEISEDLAMPDIEADLDQAVKSDPAPNERKDEPAEPVEPTDGQAVEAEREDKPAETAREATG